MSFLLTIFHVLLMKSDEVSGKSLVFLWSLYLNLSFLGNCSRKFLHSNVCLTSSWRLAAGANWAGYSCPWLLAMITCYSFRRILAQFIWVHQIDFSFLFSQIRCFKRLMPLLRINYAQSTVVINRRKNPQIIKPKAPKLRSETRFQKLILRRYKHTSPNRWESNNKSCSDFCFSVKVRLVRPITIINTRWSGDVIWRTEKNFNAVSQNRARP